MNFYASQKLADDVDFDDRTSYSERTSIYSGFEIENEIGDGMFHELIHYLVTSHFFDTRHS